MKTLPEDIKADAEQIRDDFTAIGWKDITIALADHRSNSTQPDIWVHATNPKGIRRHWTVIQGESAVRTMRSYFESDN